MKKQQKKSLKTLEYYVKLQFIVISAIFFLATTGFMIVMMLFQLPENLNFSSYYVWTLSTILLPIIVLAASYFVLPRYANKLDKLFWTLVVTFIAILLFYVAQQFTYTIPFGAVGEYYDDSDWVVAEVMRFTIGFIPLLFYYGYLYWLRKKLISK